MQNLVPLIIAGLIMYLVFFRKGAIGCCGGHGHHPSERARDRNSGESSPGLVENVIDLDEDEYTILPSSDDEFGRS